MPKISGPEGGGSKNEPGAKPQGRISRREHPPLVLAQVVYDLSRILEEHFQVGPSALRVDLRMGRFRLLEAFPSLRRTATDIAQDIAEEDGHGQDY